MKIFNDVLDYCGDSGKNDQVGSFILLTNLVASGDTTPELKVFTVVHQSFRICGYDSHDPNAMIMTGGDLRHFDETIEKQSDCQQ